MNKLMKYLQPQINTVGLVAHYKLWTGSTNGLTDIFDYSLNGLVGEWVGPNLVTDGTFDNWSSENLLDDWDESSLTANSEISNVGAGNFHSGAGTGACNIWTDDNTDTNIKQNNILTTGKTYRIKFDMWRNTGSVKVVSYDASSNFGTFNSTGSKILYFTATDEGFGFKRSSSLDITIDNISVSEVTSPPPDGRGIIFDGTNSHIDVGTGPSSVNTVAMWVKPTSVAGTDFPIDLNGTDFLTIVTGTLAINGFAGGTANTFVNGIKDATAITAGTWHLIGVTDTSGKNATDFDIGKETANFFQGAIGEVLLFDRVLSPVDMKSIYGITRSRYGV